MYRLGIVTLGLLLSFAVPSWADTALKWETTRTSAPRTPEEIKALQAAVKSVIEKVTPATLAVFYEAGAGSAVIVSEDGLVLTAAHVVTPQPALFGGGRRNPRSADSPISNRVTLLLADGKTRVRGTVLGRNARTDSAMVKIDKNQIPKDAKWPGADQGKWPYVQIGKSSDLKKGQWVVSLGHPGGPKEERRAPVRLGQMVSVSETGRRISSDCTLVGGDSGGPLFDLEGNLIGIHSSIGLDLTQNMHVPTHAFQSEWKRLLRGDMIGAVANGYLGIVLAGDDSNRKVKPVIEEVREGSPAEVAGLQANDVVLAFKGEPVETSEDIDQMMQGSRPGQTVLVRVRRGDSIYELEVTLARRPGN